jgi:hypothetical protein
MAWRDKPKVDRYGDIGSWVGLGLSIVVAQVFAADAEFWVRILIFAAGLMLGRVVGKQVAARAGE